MYLCIKSYLYIEMVRSRGYCFTINNWDDDDLVDLVGLTEYEWLTYMVIGFEVGKKGTPHIQGYMHFSDAKSFEQIKRHIPGAHLEVARATGKSYSKRWSYCMKDGDYWEYGVPPRDGVKKVTMNNVVEAISKGASYSTLVKEYPLYLLMHGDKVKRFIADSKEKVETSFYVIDPLSDAITEIVEYFDVSTNDMAVVTDLSQLEAYSDYRIVVYYVDFYDKLYDLWARGVPITYKYGYQLRVVNVEKFVIVTSSPKLFSKIYKRIV